MRRIPAVALATAVLVLGGCVAGGETYRHAWVDPATAPDKAKYNQDLEECRLIAKQAFDDSRDAASKPGLDLEKVGGTSVGMLTGAVLAGPAGLVIGGAAGSTAVSSDRLRGHLDVLYGTNRECLRSRGYTPLQ